jgi:DNA-directed RNA polymerase alpha subunit
MTAIPLPREIGRPATGALAAIGIDRLEQLTTLTEKELLAVHGVGRKAVRILRETLAERGLAFRDPGGDEPPAPDAS